ncbi:MAG: hypothetical protein IV100_09005 [Myxococcales bacterium]|nr:hypothetical protein [Myxococcales bacterium]
MQDPVLAAQCDALNQAVRQKRVPKVQRAEARRLLGAAFAFEAALEEDNEAPQVDDDRQARIAALIDAIEVLLRSAGGPADTFRPVTSRRRLDPVRIRCARPLSLRGLAAVAARYLDMGKKLDDRVEWMWARCKQNQLEPKRELTAREKAAEEFSGDDLEFVWGKKRL